MATWLATYLTSVLLDAIVLNPYGWSETWYDVLVTSNPCHQQKSYATQVENWTTTYVTIKRQQEQVLCTMSHPDRHCVCQMSYMSDVIHCHEQGAHHNLVKADSTTSVGQTCHAACQKRRNSS